MLFFYCFSLPLTTCEIVFEVIWYASSFCQWFVVLYLMEIQNSNSYLVWLSSTCQNVNWFQDYWPFYTSTENEFLFFIPSYVHLCRRYSQLFKRKRDLDNSKFTQFINPKINCKRDRYEICVRVRKKKKIRYV